MADLGGGGGDASPPTSLKVTILAEKSASILINLVPFRDTTPPPASTLRFRPKNYTQFRLKTFSLFFVFGDHLISGEKNS